MQTIRMADSMNGAIVGAVGGAGAVAGGMIAVLYEGNLVLGLILAAAIGAILSGSVAIYLSKSASSVSLQ